MLARGRGGIQRGAPALIIGVIITTRTHHSESLTVRGTGYEAAAEMARPPACGGAVHEDGEEDGVPPGRGRRSHPDAAQHILYGRSRMKHTKRHLNDVNVHG